jgi:hypothetical protein
VAGLQLDDDLVEFGIDDVPERDAGEAAEGQRASSPIVSADGGEHRAVDICRAKRSASPRNDALRIGEIDADRCRFLFGEDVRCLDLEIADRDRIGDLQPDLAVDAGIGEIIDGAAERRDLGVFAAVDGDGDQVVAAEVLPVRRASNGV